MRQLPRILLSLALTPAIFSSVAVAPQCTMFLLMRCVWYVTKDIFFCLVEYAVRSTPLRAARPKRRILVAAGGEKPLEVSCRRMQTAFFFTRSASS